MKERILNLQKKIYKQLKIKSQSLNGEMSVHFKRYERDYYKTINDLQFKECHHSDIIKRVKASRFSFISDYHTFDQSQKNYIRILRNLTKQKYKFAIALEMIHSDYQEDIDAYLQGLITTREFLENARYYENWCFPWSNYQEIFEIAKEHNIPIIALNSFGHLKNRDLHAANILKEKERTLKLPLVALFGELHLSSNHLPSYFEGNSICIVHQNLDFIYWMLQEKALKNTMVQFSPFEFCIVSSPPWLKYQSMINWYEALDDEPDTDYRDFMIRTGLKNIKSTANDLFSLLIRDSMSFLNLNIDNDIIEDFEVHDYNRFHYLLERSNEIEAQNPKLKNFYEQLLSTNYSFKLWDSNDYYCSEYTNKKMTSLVGSHLYYSNLTQSNISFRDIILNEKTKNKFSLFFFQHFWGYLTSKIFNPHTKCDLYKDLYLKNLNYAPTSSEKKIISMALDIMESSSDSPISAQTSHYKLYQIAKILGEFYCEYHYNRALSNKDIINQLIEDYFSKKPSFKLYARLKNEIFENKSYKLSKKRIF